MKSKDDFTIRLVMVFGAAPLVAGSSQTPLGHTQCDTGRGRGVWYVVKQHSAAVCVEQNVCGLVIVVFVCLFVIVPAYHGYIMDPTDTRHSRKPDPWCLERASILCVKPTHSVVEQNT